LSATFRVAVHPSKYYVTHGSFPEVQETQHRYQKLRHNLTFNTEEHDNKTQEYFTSW